MGREIKRVPVDFDWPMNKVWEGFSLPERLHELPCPAEADCFNGMTAARAWVGKVSYLLLMLDDDLNDQQRDRPMHPYFASLPEPDRGWHYNRTHGYFQPTPRPSADIREFGAGLAGRAGSFWGHDGFDHWTADKKIIEAAGLDPDVWGICPRCSGHASVEAYPGQRADAEAWEPQQPPVGEGWQMWETVSEGSPVSPVFETPEGLAHWLTTFEGGRAAGPSKRPMTIEQALGFVKAGWAPTGFITAGGVHDGAEFVGTQEALRRHDGGAA